MSEPSGAGTLVADPQNRVSELLAAGVRQHQAGDLRRAEASYREVLGFAPGHPDAWNLLGVIAHQYGQHGLAVEYIGHAIATLPGEGRYYNNLGVALQGLGRRLDALAAFRRAVELNPDDAEAQLNLGAELSKAGDAAGAIAHYRELLRLRPGDADLHLELAALLQGAGEYDEAALQLERAALLRPDHAEIYARLGVLCVEQLRFGEAEGHFREALRLEPASVQGHNNLGAALLYEGEFAAAQSHLEQALRVDPGFVPALRNRFWLLMLAGRLREGWMAHGSRELADPELVPSLALPRWDGGELEGKAILICAEQGIGDEIMYASCFTEVAARARHCAIQCEPRLAPLFARSFPRAEVVGGKRPDVDWDALIEDADCYCPAGDLPHYLRPDLQSFPSRQAYLLPDPDAVQVWQQRFDGLAAECVVGLSWRGGDTPQRRRLRSITLRALRPLTRIAGVEFVNLQYGADAAELAAAAAELGKPLHHWDEADPLVDLDGFAAKLAALDAVVTVDNSTAHLAGALGVRTYTLLPFVPEWRWLLERSDSPWYPSMQLFRQAAADDWSTPIEQAAAVLAELVTSKRRA
jgi:Flp pilus assembly protein TadD